MWTESEFKQSILQYSQGLKAMQDLCGFFCLIRLPTHGEGNSLQLSRYCRKMGNSLTFDSSNSRALATNSPSCSWLISPVRMRVRRKTKYVSRVSHRQ